jgi:hypothetical protein
MMAYRCPPFPYQRHLRSGLLHPSPAESPPSANQNLPWISHTSLGSPGVFQAQPAEFAVGAYENEVRSSSRPKSNEEAVVDGNGQHTTMPSRPGILCNQNHSRFSSGARLVHKVSSTGTLIGIDESGDAERGEEGVLMPEPASTSPKKQ